MTSFIPSLTLERFLLAELPENEREAIEKALADDPALRRRVEELRASNAETLERHRSSVLGPAIRGRCGPRPQREKPRLKFALAATFCAAVVVIAIGFKGPNPGPPPPETLRPKGAISTLSVFRKTPFGSEALHSGSRALKGDLVRLGYRTFAARYGVIVSVDGRNTVTRHWPSRGDMAAPMQGGTLVLLDQAFELDDAPLFERFYLVTSDHGFAIDVVISGLRDGGPGGGRGPKLPAEFEFTSVELQKEPSK